MMLTLNHPNIVRLLGISVEPLVLVCHIHCLQIIRIYFSILQVFSNLEVIMLLENYKLVCNKSF